MPPRQDVVSGEGAVGGIPAGLDDAEKLAPGNDVEAGTLGGEEAEDGEVRICLHGVGHLVIDAVCPGLVDTAASRPWFEDMSKAQTPAAAAADIIWLATTTYDPALPYGELVRHREVLPWAG